MSQYRCVSAGAHEGRGLGRMFLRHLRRTRVILHVVDAAAPDPAADYWAVREELRMYNPEYCARPHVVALNKMDLEDASELQEEVKAEVCQHLSSIYPPLNGQAPITPLSRCAVVLLAVSCRCICSVLPPSANPSVMCKEAMASRKASALLCAGAGHRREAAGRARHRHHIACRSCVHQRKGRDRRAGHQCCAGTSARRLWQLRPVLKPYCSECDSGVARNARAGHRQRNLCMQPYVRPGHGVTHTVTVSGKARVLSAGCS